MIQTPTSAHRMLFDMLQPAERRRLFMLMPLILLNAVIQVVGIASIMPFMALVASPETIQTNPLLRWLFDTLGFASATSFLAFVGLGVLGVLIVSNTTAAWTHLLLLRFSWDTHHALAVQVLGRYLAKPYAYFLSHNTSDMAKNILLEVREAVAGFLVSSMMLAAQLLTTLLILALLVIVSPLLAVSSLGMIGGVYFILFRFVRQRVARAGRVRSVADWERLKVANEALSGIKDIKVLGMERAFLERFEVPSWRFGRAMSIQTMIGTLPRYAFETLAFGSLVLIVVVWLSQGRDLATVLQTLGVFAFASYRLLPALQSIFQSLTSMRFSASSIEVLYAETSASAADLHRLGRDATAPMEFRHRLELRAIEFAYEGASKPLFNGFDLVIEANTSVALVGETGSGKTTAIDLMLGLLTPQAGSLRVDGMPIGEENLAAWQRNIGYVPQVIFLADDTVAANIALGVRSEDVDMGAVHRAAKQANVYEFIMNELPDGFDTPVGERGIRLSGGQRQRLGIARALYRDPSVLVLDEATSALDNVTEESVFGAVKQLGASKTVVMIAHRISTVRDCDVIHVLANGRIIASGSYDELVASSPAFRALAKVDRTPVGAVL